jgi:hypothetical protein
MIPKLVKVVLADGLERYICMPLYFPWAIKSFMPSKLSFNLNEFAVLFSMGDLKVPTSVELSTVTVSSLIVI